MKKKYQALIIGDTFGAYGISQVIPDCCIVDSQAQIGWDFISTFNYGRNWMESGSTALSQELKAELLEKRILTEEGLVQCPALAPVLYQRVKNSPVCRLYMARVTAVQKEEGGYRVELFHDEGFSEVTAEFLIDTTGAGERETRRQLRTIVDFPYAKAQSWDRALCFVQSARKELCVAAIDASDCGGLSQARAKLHEIWTRRPGSMKNAKIAYVADEFFREYPPLAEPGRGLNSQAFDNPLEAIDAGQAFARALLEERKE